MMARADFFLAGVGLHRNMLLSTKILPSASGLI